MGKVESRRTGIIEYLKHHGSVERKELWTHFNISETRLCEDLKTLQMNGCRFDTSKSGYISLMKGSNTNASVYEPITTPIIRRWILIAWISMCSELRTDFYSETIEHVGQKSVYKSLCKFYSKIYEKNDEKKFVYLLNAFHRDVREACQADELTHNSMRIFNAFEEKDLFRLSNKSYLVVFTKSLATKYLFALNELDQRNRDVRNLRDRIRFAYLDYETFPSTKLELKNVYDRLSLLASFTSIKRTYNDVEFIAANTGLPVEQVKKDLKTLQRNNIGRRLFGKNGFRTTSFFKSLSVMSNLFDIYNSIKNPCILYLPASEYTLFKEIRNLSFIRPDFNENFDSQISLYGGKGNWHDKVEQLWYED